MAAPVDDLLREFLGEGEASARLLLQQLGSNVVAVRSELRELRDEWTRHIADDREIHALERAKREELERRVQDLEQAAEVTGVQNAGELRERYRSLLAKEDARRAFWAKWWTNILAALVVAALGVVGGILWKAGH